MTIFKEAKSGIAFINYIDQEGKRRKKSTGLPYTKENIKIIEKNVFPRLKEKLLGKNVDKNISVIKQYTVKEICLLFLEEKERTSIRRYTIKDYGKILIDNFVPFFEGVMINNITSDDLQIYFLKQKETKSVKMSNEVLNWAV